MANHERHTEHIFPKHLPRDLPENHAGEPSPIAGVAASAYAPEQLILLADARRKQKNSEPQSNFVLDFMQSIFGPKDQPKAQPKGEPKNEARPARRPTDASRNPDFLHQAKFFAGGIKSWVSRCVGAAEGNLRTDGTIISEHYNGHRDLNGKWNKGVFSNQVDEGATPDEANKIQLARLKGHDKTISSLAARHHLNLSIEERMNALDLANQAEGAVLKGWGFIERLSLAKKREGLTGHDAILHARKWAFFNPEANEGKGKWESAVFGNDPKVIEADQRRRMLAIAETLKLLHKGK